ncbi:MAG: glycosyl transferase group 1 [Gemmatimonadetes bacterium]|nr:glycosyl transferase group 1 [Gemmatimonadota bacterium]
MTSVLLTVGSLDSRDGGPSRSVAALGRALNAEGHRANVVTCGAPASAAAAPTVRVVSYGAFGGRALRAVHSAPFRAALMEQAEAHKAELVHDNGVWLQTNHASARAARDLSLPLVVSPRGMLEPWSLRHRAWKKRIAWPVFQRNDLRGASLLHATSDLEAASLRALGLGVPIAVVPNGVDLPATRPRETKIDTAERIVLFLSRIHPKKGLLDLVAAWAALRPSGWRVIVAGPDEDGHAARVAGAAAAAGVGGAFSFVGEVGPDAAAELWQRASLFVLPSHSENFGIAVAESLARAVPVVTTTATPWAALSEWQCGWCVEPEPAALADALREALALSDEQRQAMGERGRAEVQARFAWPSVARQMAEVYRWVLDGGSPPSSVMLP